MDRVIESRTATFTRTFKDSAGVLVDADDNFTVTVYDGAGVEHHSATTTHPSTGVYQFSLTPAKTTPLDSYSIKWEPVFGGVAETHWSYFEVVGAVYFTIADARAHPTNTSETALSDTAAYPDQAIIDKREEVEQDIEEITRRAWVRRGHREDLDGDGRSLIFPSKLYGVAAPYSVVVTKSDGTTTTFDADDLADIAVTEGGGFRRRSRGVWLAGHGNIAVHYAHGENEVPGPLRWAALEMLKHRLIPTDIPDRAQSATDEMGTVSLWVAAGTRNRWTGYPSVDAILNRFRSDHVGVA